MTQPTREEALAHFGVKGMHWGVRRDPKTGIRPIATALNNSKFGKAAIANNQRYAEKQVAKYEKQELKKTLKEAKKKGNAGFVDPATLYASYAVATLAMYGGLKVAQTFDSGNARVLVNKGKRAVVLDKAGAQYKKNPALAKKNMSEAQIMKTVVAPINPGYGKFGTKMNCRRCTLAYEMRRRGIDVKATGSTMATGQHGTGLRKATGSKTKTADWGETKVYPFGTNPKDKASGPTAIFKRLSTQPDGSRGELGVGWQMGGGHSIAYEIVGGKPVLFDTQRGLKMKTAAELNKAYDLTIGAAAITRLDNKVLNEQWLERWVQNND